MKICNIKVTYLYITRKMNQAIIDPQMARCVSHVQAFVTSPAFKQTVTTTYYKRTVHCNIIP